MTEEKYPPSSKKHAVPTAWTVPLALLFGITLVLAMHWPLWLGLLIGYLWAAVYSHRLGHAWYSTAAASLQGIKKLWKISLILILIGYIVVIWMYSGSIPTMITLSTRLINAHNIIWVGFAASAALSMIIGSSIATWSVIGPTLMAIAPAHLLPFVAGALVSGGMVGDRSSPMSSSVVIMSTTCELPVPHVLRRLLITAAAPVFITLTAFFLANQLLHSAGPTRLDPLTGGVVTWASLALPAIVILLSMLRVSLLINLFTAVMLGNLYLVFVIHNGFTPLVWSRILNGYPLPLASGSTHMGGVIPMALASLLIITAGAFQGVTELSGVFRYLVQKVIRPSYRGVPFVLSSYLLAIGFTLLMGSQMLAVLMTGNSLQEAFIKRGLGLEALLQVVADFPELISALVPWNLLGLQAALILQVPTWSLLPYAWFIFIAMAFSVARTLRMPQRTPQRNDSTTCT